MTPHQPTPPADRHSPLPWKQGMAQQAVFAAGGFLICRCDGNESPQMNVANAALIVRAVNHNKALREALEALLWKVNQELSFGTEETWYALDKEYHKARQALAAAGRES